MEKDIAVAKGSNVVAIQEHYKNKSKVYNIKSLAYERK